MLSDALIDEDVTIATLLVRKLDETVVARLKARAKAHGRFVEAEHRAILEAVLDRESPMPSSAETWQRLRRFGTADFDLPRNEDAQVASFD